MIVSIGLACVFGLLRAASALDRTWDDAAITLGYARTLAETGSVRFGAFGEKVEGFSTFLWMLICAGLASFARDPTNLLAAAQAACAALYLFNALLTFRLASRVLDSAWAPLAVTWAYCGLAASSSGIVDGMENHLFLSLHLGLALALHAGRTAALPALCFAVMLCRPEGALTVCAALISVGLRSRQPVEPRNRRALAGIALGVALMAGFLCWRFAYFGSWVPNSVNAKMWTPYFESLGSRLQSGLSANGRFAQASLLWLLPALVLSPHRLAALPAALANSVRRNSFASLSILGFFIFHLGVGHPRGTLNRVWLALIPMTMIVGADVLRGASVAMGPLRATACAAAFLWVQGRQFQPTERQPITVARIHSLLAPAVRFAKAARLDRPLRLAAPDMGAPLLYFGQEVWLHDLALLNNRKTARSGWRAAADDLFESPGPDIIETHAPWTDLNGIGGDPRLAGYQRVSIDGRFYLVRRELIERLLAQAAPAAWIRPVSGLEPEEKARLRSRVWTDFRAGEALPVRWSIDIILLPIRDYGG